MKKTKMLLAAALAVIMLCSVLPMGVMAQENNVIEASLMLYMGSFMGDFDLMEDEDYVAKCRPVPFEFTDDSDSEAIIARFISIGENSTLEDLLRFLFEQMMGHMLTAWNIYAVKGEAPCLLTDEVYSEGDTNVTKPVYVGSVEVGEYYSGFEFNFYELFMESDGYYTVDSIIIEPVLERWVIAPQPQNTNPGDDGYFTAGVKYYVPVKIGPENMYADASEILGKGTWADAEADNSIVDVEYQWYMVGDNATTVEITDENDVERAYWWLGEYDDGAWKSDDDTYNCYIDIGISVEKDDIVSFNVPDDIAHEIYIGYLDEYNEDEQDYDYLIDPEKISSDTHTAVQNGILYVYFLSEEPLSAEVTLTHKDVIYTEVSGRTSANLLEGGENADELILGESYVCRAYIVDDRFEPDDSFMPRPAVLTLEDTAEENESGAEGESEYIKVLESDPVVYNIKPEEPAEPAEPEKKSVFNDWMKMFFYMKENFEVFDTYTDGGKINVKSLSTGNLSVSYKCSIVPEEGYAIKSVLVDGVDVGAVEEYIFKSMTKDHTIHAIFEEIAEEESEEQ